MARGRKQDREPVREPERDAADYYRLKTQAVEDLVTADESNSPVVSEAEPRRGRTCVAPLAPIQHGYAGH